MKTKKIVALVLSMAMVLGVAACSKDAAETSAPADGTTAAAPAETQAPAATDATPETQVVKVDTGAYSEEDVPEVEDTKEYDGKFVIYGFNTEFQERYEKYSSVKPDEYMPTKNDGNAYTQLLDTVLIDAQQAPDMFVCDADYVKKYIDNGKGDHLAATVNSIGIDNDELKDMYDYTLKFAADSDNYVRGLTWQATPCGVFYNRTVAQATLGVSEPDEVAPYFESWEAFLDTAVTVKEASTDDKEYRVVAGWGDTYRAYLNTRTTAWVVDGTLTIDPKLEGFYDTATTLHEDDLTFEIGQWSSEWFAGAENETVLSYWGPMWLGYSLSLAEEDKGNPTYGDWGMVPSPNQWYWGGTWMMSSNYNDHKASTAQIMRDMINPDTLRDITKTYGDFTNDHALMTEIASSDEGNLAWLAGQNPFGLLIDTASVIDMSVVGIDDATINDTFNAAIGAMLEGTSISTPAEANQQFREAIVNAGIAEQ